MNRRLARELALKVLYWYEISNDKIDMIMNEIFSRKNYRTEVKQFSQRLIMQTFNNLKPIDEEIKGTDEHWEYKRITMIDKLILRLGICELLFFKDIPFQVIINEAVEIAKKYSGDGSNRFINGILDAIAKKFRNNHGV